MNFFKKLILLATIVVSIVVSPTVNAAYEGSWWERTFGTDYISVIGDLDVGGISDRISALYVNVLNATTLIVTGVMTGDLDMDGFDILNVDHIFGNTAILPVQIGDAGTTARGLVSEDDLLATGKLEVLDSAFFESRVDYYAHIYLQDSVRLLFGNAGDAMFAWETAQTPDTLYVGTGTDSNAVLLAEKADRGYDFAHPLQTNPTLFINSANQSANEWISFTHDQTSGVIDVGTGDITLNDFAVLNSGGRSVGDLDIQVGFGIESNDGGTTAYYPDITDQTPATGILGTGTLANSFILAEKGDTAFDFAHAIETDPTLFIHSANQATDEWISLQHDQTDGIIETGTGDVKFSSSILAGAYEFAEDAGFLAAMDMSVSATPTAGDQMSYTFKIDGESFLKIFSEADSAGGIQNPSIRFFQPTVYGPSDTQVLVAGTGLTVTKPIMRIDSGAGGAVTMTATPTVIDGVDGECVIIQGDDDTNTIQFQDEANLANSGLQLSGGIDFTFGQGDMLELCYDAGDDNWYELSRSDN